MRPTTPRGRPPAARTLPLAVALLAVTACAPSSEPPSPTPLARAAAGPPSPDPRIGLGAGLMDAEQAIWNLRLVSATPPPAEFVGRTNSDLAFSGNYAIQGNYHGIIIWDISNPARPTLVEGHVCPASQSDVSAYRNLLFVSGEGTGGRLDCGTEGVSEAVSHDRLRGIRIFDISDVRNPKYIANVQTCRGSHTHSLLVDPKDTQNVYIYVSGSSFVRPPEELPGCSRFDPDEDPNSALFRIEVIRVPLANPQAAAIVNSPRIFEDLVAPPRHGLSEADIADLRARNAFLIEVNGEIESLNFRLVREKLDSLVKARGGEGFAQATSADSAALRSQLPAIAAELAATRRQPAEPRPGPDQCHDITLYPEIGRAGGACEGYGLLLDISDPTNPRRIDAVSDVNFSYWHSATFNNDGSQILFSDEWGGGGGPKCRAGDPMEWGADAIFTVESGRMQFQSYFKLPAVQTSEENCVAHNGSLIPIPGRDIMVQAWYQGGINVFDWTDPRNPYEIAFFDRGPVDATRMRSAGSWSVYWYNGVLVSSEIARGLDILELVPSPHLTQNEIDAAKTVTFDHFNTQGQQMFVWPPSFPLARAYVDQLERSSGLSAARITEVRNDLAAAEGASGAARGSALTELAHELDAEASRSRDAARVRMLAGAVRELAASR